ncbi:hypothetical protein [Siccirubricoccus phaeus]|uniref:hypothetical protein n=1 Tax=Siccirubricoccus phaeus TaxID=2595053 RepID=UPI0011F133E5|nr:hypothetical protein [Siccirubricoccus phaeus]
MAGSSAMIAMAAPSPGQRNRPVAGDDRRPAHRRALTGRLQRHLPAEGGSGRGPAAGRNDHSQVTAAALGARPLRRRGAAVAPAMRPMAGRLHAAPRPPI